MNDLNGVVSLGLEAAKARGADSADAILIEQKSVEVSILNGATEHVERSEGYDLGLRVFCGKSQAIVSTNKLDQDTIQRAAGRAVDMARAAPPDPFAGLAAPEQLAQGVPDLDLWDGSDIGEDALRGLAKEAEDAGLSVKGVSRSTGAGASMSTRQIVLGTSDGFLKSYRRSGYGVSVAVIAGDGTGMERDYDFSSSVHFHDLRPAAEIGRNAGERAVRRLHPRKVSSQRVSIVYDRRIAASLIGHLAGAISGPAVARGTSFLKDMLNKQVFSPGITIIDDPHMTRGLGSRPFDAEGVRVWRMDVVAEGTLRSFLLDQSSARQLRLEPTGHASRGTGSQPSPSPSNFYLAKGTLSPDALMADIGKGLYVTELLGMGVNGVTGDYSRGAAGFWIENGALTHPVSEVTIAGNLKDMYRNLTPADDLEFRMAMNAPTCRVEGMTIAGA
ncbi:MAG TPA: TldD/PmbA family protein [Aestuariivirgaceae bacterium]|nr:TldD/PmbA family protein [Aestuariivirgaceae bacterium]